MPRRRVLASLLLLPLLAGCATAPPRAAPTPSTGPAAPTTAATALPDDDLWVEHSAEYAAATWEAYALAGSRIEALARGHQPATWGVILDVDETVLSNVEFEIELAHEGRDFDDPAWRRWENRGVATAIPGAAAFCHRVQALGGKVVLVTNREEEQRAPTEANLRHEGVPFDLLVMRAHGGANDKTTRWTAVQQGTAAPGVPALEALMWVGDNIKDFPGGDQSWRAAGERALEPFGNRFIVIPNPMYGSWKPSSASPAAPKGTKGEANTGPKG